jgi:hypothetical protein
VTDEARDQDAAGSAGAEGADGPSLESWSGAPEQSTWTPIDPNGETGAGGGRVRRPSSLLGDTPIPPRAAALRTSLSEKIAAVSHGATGGSPTGGDAGTGGGGIPGGGPVPLPGGDLIERLRTLVAERPEVAVGAAFVGGLVLASILKRLAR